MPTILLVQKTVAGFGGSSSQRTLTYTSNVTAGNLLVVGISTYLNNTLTTVTVTDTQGNSYQQIGNYSTLGGQTVSLWYAIASSTGANTVNYTPNTSVFSGIGILEYSSSIGWVNNPVDNVIINTGSGFSLTTGQIAVTGSNELIVAVFGQTGNTDSFTAGTGFTLECSQNNGSSEGGIWIEDAISSSHITATGTVTPSSIVYAAIAVSLNPVGNVQLYASEITTGPPIPGAPWKSNYIEGIYPKIQGPTPNIQYVQSAVAISATTISFKKVVTKGNLLVVFVGTSSLTPNVTLVEDNLGQIYNPIGTSSQATQELYLEVFYFENTQSGSPTITVTLSSGTSAVIGAVEYLPLVSGGMLDAVITNTGGNGSKALVGNLIIKQPGELTVAAMLFTDFTGNNNITASNPLQLRQTIYAGTSYALGLSLADDVYTQNTFNPTFNLGGTFYNASIAVSFKYNPTQARIGSEILTGPPIPGAPWKSTYQDVTQSLNKTPVFPDNVQSQQSALGTGATNSVTLLNPVTKGNLIVVTVISGQSTPAYTITGVKDNLGQTYNLVKSIAVYNSAIVGLYYFEGSQSGSVTITATFSSSVANSYIIASEYAVQSSGNLLDVSVNATNTVGSSTTTSPIIIPAKKGELVVSAIMLWTETRQGIISSNLTIRQNVGYNNLFIAGALADSLNSPSSIIASFLGNGNTGYGIITAAFKSNSSQPQSPELLSRPPMIGAPWFKSPPIVNTQTTVQIDVESVSDTISITDSVTVFNQLKGSYAPEVVTGPPIPGAPWKSTYLEPVIQINSPHEIVSDTISLSDSVVGFLGIFNNTYAPEIVTGPPIPGAPWHSTYVEFDNHVKQMSVSASSSVSITDSAVQLIYQSYAPEIVTGPPIPGAPWRSVYVEGKLKDSALPEVASDTITITQSVTELHQYGRSLSDTIQISHVTYVFNLHETISQNITITDSVTNNWHVESASDSINITQSVTNHLLTQYASNKVTITDSASTSNLHQFVADNIFVTDSIYQNIKNVNVNNTIAITEDILLIGPIYIDIADTISVSDSVHYSPNYQSASDQIVITDLVITSGYSTVLTLADQITVSDVVNIILPTQSVSDTITLTDSASRLSTPVDSITLTDRVSFILVKQGTPNSPVYAPEIRTGPPLHGAPWKSLYVEPVTWSTKVNRQNVSSTVTVTDSVSYFVASQMSSSGTPIKPVVGGCRQDKSFAPNGSPPYTAPTIVTRTSIILTYPYDSPSVTLTLRNPEFNNQYKRTIERIIRNTRNNKLLTFRDPQWPLFTRLNYTIRLLKQTDAQNMLLFFTQSLGQQIGLLDFESRQWQGVILNPQAAMEFVNRPRIKSFQIEFEGNLVP